MRVAIVLNGEPPGPEELALLPGCDAVVCADGGARAVARAGIVPDWVVGDLDSLAEEEAAMLAARGAHIERHPAAKDFTDGELALARALAMKPSTVVFLGAHGSDTAHFLANLVLLRRCHEAGFDARMVGRGEALRFVSPGRDLVLRDAVGKRLSLLAQDAEAVVDLQGTAWAGEGIAIAHQGARGLSNKVAADPAVVRVRRGLVLAVVAPPE